MLWRIKFTPGGIFTLAVFMHVFFLGGVFDIYFTSPLEADLPSYRSEAEPFAKRVVLFISDGLRAEGLLKYATETPYLTNIRENIGVWGVGHTQVPTESRPGHIGILGGIYEDPSAIFKGWQANTVEFDSVIKQAKNVFSWGCPDIVNIFQGPNVTIQPYDDPELKDFSGKKAYRKLDSWVFEQVAKNLTKQQGENCGRFCEDGNIFFLHLLGMDTVGHVFKPDSSEYQETLEAVSSGVEVSALRFDEFFKDNKTAYIFTSDHGMTNRGSHGSGSDHETEIPVIGWGSGFGQNSLRQDINQTDLAPLIASLLGVNIPTNSIGRLPLKYLSGTPQQLAGAVLANVHQIGAHFLKKDDDSRHSFFNVPFRRISGEDFRTTINYLNKDFKDELYNNVLKRSFQVIDLGLQGIRYYQYFYQIPTLVYLTIIFLLWFVFVMVFISTSQQTAIMSRPRTKGFDLYRRVLPAFYIINAVVILMMFVFNVHFKYLIYATVGISLFFLLNQLFLQYAGNIRTPLRILKGSLMFLYMEILVISFFNRQYLGIALVIVMAWGSSTYHNIPKNLRMVWTVSICFLSMFLFLETADTFSYPLFLGTLIVFRLILWFNMRIRRLPFSGYLFITSCANAFYIAVSFDKGNGVPQTCIIFTYFNTFAALMTISMGRAYVINRLEAVVIALMCIYIHMTMHLEGLFYSAIVTVMYTWLKMEVLHATHLNPPVRAWYDLQQLRFDGLPKMRWVVNLDDFRRVLFFLTFILVCFFGTGNIASISSFNPMAARAFSSDFLPHLIMIVLIFKICIPFIVCMCTFVLILKVVRANIPQLFGIIMLFCDVMVLNFMFMVKNEGSWLEIGTSLSHFVIAEAMTLVLSVLFFVCLFVLKSSSRCLDHATGMENWWKKFWRPESYMNAKVYRKDEEKEPEHQA